MERNPLMPCCYTLGWLADAEGRLEHENVHANWPLDFSQEALPYLLSENRILASSVMFRKGKARFDPSLRYSGDWVALLRATLEAPIGCIPARLSHWRQHSANTYRRSPKQVAEEIRVRRAILEDANRWFVERIPKEDIRAGLARCAVDLAALMVLCGRPRDARHYALRAVRLAPNKRIALRRFLLCSLPISVARERLWPADSSFVADPLDPRPIDWSA
jgi:hypothetical protein